MSSLAPNTDQSKQGCDDHVAGPLGHGPREALSLRSSGLELVFVAAPVTEGQKRDHQQHEGGRQEAVDGRQFPPMKLPKEGRVCAVSR